MAKAASEVDPFTGKVDIATLEFSELMAMMDQGELIHLRELDDTDVVSKEELVGIPFIITEWEAKTGELGTYVVIRAVTQSNNRIVFADGSTGIKDQLLAFGIQDKPILIHKGLRVSNYTYEDEEGKRIPASTYYLDTSA